MSEERIPVLCCCNPSNEIGTAPANLEFPKREWVDEDGNSGWAYPSGEHGHTPGCPEKIDWSKVPGFISKEAAMAHRGEGKMGKKRKGKRKPKKTWKEKRKTWRDK